MDFIIDSSILATYLFSEKSNLYIDKIMNSFKLKQAIAPSSFLYEISDILKNAITKNKVTHEQAKSLLNLVSELNIKIHQIENFMQMREILDLSSKHELSLSASSYLFTSIKMNLPLATNNQKLIKITKTLGLYYI